MFAKILPEDDQTFRFLHNIEHGNERSYIKEFVEEFLKLFDGLHIGYKEGWVSSDVFQFSFQLIVKELKSEQGRNALMDLGISIPNVPACITPKYVEVHGNIRLYPNRIDLLITHPMLPSVISYIIHPRVCRLVHRMILRIAHGKRIHLEIIA